MAYVGSSSEAAWQGKKGKKKEKEKDRKVKRGKWPAGKSSRVHEAWEAPSHAAVG